MGKLYPRQAELCFLVSGTLVTAALRLFFFLRGALRRYFCPSEACSAGRRGFRNFPVAP